MKKKSLSLLFPSFLVLFWLSTSPFLFAQTSDAKSGENKNEIEPVRVRFVCAASIRPLKYRPGPDGIMATYYEDGESPPDQIFYKEGKDYKLLNINTNSEPGQCVVSADKKGRTPSVFYTRKITPAKPGGKGELGKATIEYSPLISVSGLGGTIKDALVCLYNPDPVGHWCPPKTRVIDTSLAAVPQGALLIVNLSGKTTALRLASGQVTTVSPGQHAVVKPTSKTVDQVTFKLAVVGNKSESSLVADSGYSSPAGSRQVLTIYTVNGKFSRTGIDCFVGNL